MKDLLAYWPVLFAWLFLLAVGNIVFWAPIFFLVHLLGWI